MPKAEDLAEGESESLEGTAEFEESGDFSEFDDGEMDFDATEESFLDKIWADTGEGELHEYDDHVLNFTGREGNKRLCRAIEGFGLDASKAIVDAVIGAVQELKAMDSGGS